MTRRRHRFLRGTAIGGACAAAAMLGLVALARHEGHDITGSSTIEFRAPHLSVPSPSAPAPTAVRWTTYGGGPARLRFLEGTGLRPPFRLLWTWHAQALVEFPPVVAAGRLFVETFDGRLYALDARTGRARWRFDSARCGWSSPTIAGRLVIATFIGRACRRDVPGSDGEVIAFSRSSGAIRWRRTIGPTESSPVVAGGLLYLGDWSGRIYALAPSTGRTRWIFHAGGAVKGSPAVAAGRLYVGAYDGHVYALDAHTGRLRWRASGQPRLGSHGTFYSSPAVAYDRVYIGSTDGKVYSFGAESGRLRWSRSTGGYVYASAAVWRNLVLVGSYDRRFYALDAATGAERWSFGANERISGAATVVDGVVYFSTFGRRTYGLSAATGKLLWAWPDGEYSPVITDGRRIYLTGRGRIYGLSPR
jgi:outer membrane protein assembly factor BamB